MSTIGKWFTIVVVLVIVTASVTFLILTIAGNQSAAHCGSRVADAYARCNDLRTYSLSRSGYLAAVIGISLSFIATIALVVTILLSSRATKAAVEAANLARVSVDHSRETSSRELRPYLLAVGYNMRYEPDAEGAPKRWFVNINWKNSGKTPAQGVIARANSFLSTTANLPANFDYPDRNDVTEHVGIVGMDNDFNSPTPWLSFEEIAAVADNRLYLHIWSWVEYEGFEAGKRYRSEYHSRMWFLGNPKKNEEFKSGILLEWDFNGLDEKCSRKPKTLPSAVIS